VTPARIAELRAALKERDPAWFLGWKDVAELLDALEEAERACDLAPHAERAGCFCASCLLRRTEAALEAARDALEAIAHVPDGPIVWAVERGNDLRLAEAALARLPPRRTP
jgi:hypothetical protein